jgi:fatty acid-binding protein DegV
LIRAATQIRSQGYENEDVVFQKVPLKINVGSDEFSDAAGFDPEPMLNALEAYQGKTCTAAPSPGEWRTLFPTA